MTIGHGGATHWDCKHATVQEKSTKHVWELANGSGTIARCRCTRMVKTPTKDDGLTPTQRRNARKRRSKQKESKKLSNPKRHDHLNQDHGGDPSQRYIKNPRKCPIAKAAKLFFEQTKHIDFPIILGKTVGWRTVAKLAVRNVDGELRLGLFAPKSHVLIPASNSPAHHESINTAIRCIESTTSYFEISAYDESSGTGLLRHVIFSVETSTGRVQATFVVHGSEHSKTLFTNVAHCLTNERPKLWHSIWFHANNSWKHANNIVAIGGEFRQLDCARDLKTTCPFGGITESYQNGVPLHFPPSVFRQANLQAFHSIVKAIQVYLTNEIKNRPTSILELYGGVGTIGLNIASLCSELVSSDENPHNITCFNKSVEIMLAITKEKKVNLHYVSASAETMVQQGALAKADLVVVDPPRKGLDLVVARALAQAKHIDCLVYVSCGFAAFERDCAILEQGGFQLHKAEGHILFPGSDAIETLAFFRRSV
jgi:23S rRNA (uracil1939-C5)-methyltransferase